uniref:TM269 protein n=1 Tax=Calidris pygmaea TaxID=425635 RepID=A0A8C3J4K2_9CHAR
NNSPVGKGGVGSAAHRAPGRVAGIFQCTKKLFLSERTGRGQTLEFIRKNAANGLSVANLVAGLSSVLCSLNRWGGGKKKKKRGGGNGVKKEGFKEGRGVTPVFCPLPRQYHHSCWLLLVGFLLDLADGAVARRLDACSALGESIPPPPRGTHRRGSPSPCLSPSPPPPKTIRQLPRSLPAGAKLDDFADFTTFGLATALLLQPQGALDGLLAIAYVMAVFARLCFFSSAGIPFTYRGLPCPYASSLLVSTFLLTAGNVTLLHVIAIIMVLFMVDRGLYPHDKVLESQLWKKLVYAGGVVAVLFLPATVASVYCLVWSTSYIIFPFAVWSCAA